MTHTPLRMLDIMRYFSPLPVLLAFVLAGPLQAQGPKGTPLRAGAATSNITPPLGLAIVGGFAPYPATHVHDELHARCLVIDDGKVKLVFVVCDLLGLDRNVSDEARDLIEKDLKIPRSHVLISATHTHSASSALGKNPRKIGNPTDEYQRFVSRRIADTAKRAVNLLRPAEIGWGTVDIPEHLNNRRWHLKEGSKFLVNPFGQVDRVRMNPPSGNPDLIEPAGPIDPTVSFLVAREAPGKDRATAGRPIGLFAAYSLHYVGGVGPGHISADYFGMFCDELTRLLGVERQTPPFVPMLANGTSGDINNIDFRKPRPRKAAYEQMKYVADDVAAKVHAALKKVEFRSTLDLDARYREPAIGTRRPDEKTLAWARAKLAEEPAKKGRTDLSRIYAERTLRMAEHPPTLKIPLQAFRIGPVSLATMPCEVFCEIGLAYRKKSPLQPAFMVSLNHGYYGYLPTPRHFELGGYETWLGTNRLEPQASEKMFAELLEMSAEMRKR